MRVALTGSSGFVGSYFRKKFPDHIVIDRDDTVEVIEQKLQSADVVINLAGAPILKRWSESYKNLLVKSRVDSTRKLVQAINNSDVKHFISTSAIGAYPDNQSFDESFKKYADDFLGQLTKAWEDEALQCNKPTSIVRFSVILGSDGGALAQMLTPFKLGFGGVIGDGSMCMSWIDIEDLYGIYNHILSHSLTGVFNASSPNPVSNKEFTKTLGDILHRPTFLPLPEFVLKLIYGEGASVLTSSKEVYPQAILNAGYSFKYPNIKSSLEHILQNR